MQINRSALKTYAPKARKDFIAAMVARAARFGISKSEIVDAREQGDVVIIGADAFPRKVGAQRRKLIARIKLHGFDQTMEEVAYTWFNRLLAIRYMELHGYLDHGYRVLSHPAGKELPEILEHAEHFDFAGLNKNKVIDLKLDGTKDAELYRLLLIAQCNALNTAMPFLFERIDDETELLLPDNLLHTDSLIRKLVTSIDEADWQEIEIIGWLYQFYISEKKDQVIGKVVKSEDIPAATQLFTPNWIVKYMVQNSLGAQWLATYPDSPLKAQMEYYIEPAEQTEEVQRQLDDITPKELNPEELTLMDPACGSGHILVEAYDLFKAIYLERGYRLRDVPRLILEKNLFGLDIDDRAAQMAGFALLMKAREDDRRILLPDNPPTLNVMAITDSKALNADEIARTLIPNGRFDLLPNDDLLPNSVVQPVLSVKTNSSINSAEFSELINLFQEAKVLGSLLKVDSSIAGHLARFSQLIKVNQNDSIFEAQAKNLLHPVVTEAELLSKSYDVVVANPPYMGLRNMNPMVKAFLKEEYKSSKNDLYSAFVEQAYNICKRGGTIAFVTMQSWMFLSSYEGFRKFLIGNSIVQSIAQFGANAFEFLIGPTVQTCAFSLRKFSCQSYRGAYFELTAGDFDEKARALRANENCYSNLSQDTFLSIEGCPIAYWCSASVLSAFANGDRIGDYLTPRQGMATSDNARFLRQWHEVNSQTLDNGSATQEEAASKKKKWFAYNKGGTPRRWFGNRENVVNWENEGLELLQYAAELYGSPTRTIKNISQYFKECLTWGDISFKSSSGSVGFAARFSPAGALFDITGPSGFPKKEDSLGLLGVLNSKIISVFMPILNPTMHFQVGDIARVPVQPEVIRSPDLRSCVQRCIEISKDDWNSYERSQDFSSPSIMRNLGHKTRISAAFDAYVTSCLEQASELRDLEEKLNRILISSYGLSGELEPAVSLSEVTLTSNPYYRYSVDLDKSERGLKQRTDTISELISYSIGCMIGRYSLAKPGLIYANSGNKGFDPSSYGDFPADEDGIIPITQLEWFDDDAAVRFEEFLKAAWTPETLRENLRFVAESLVANGRNDPEKAIRTYFSKSFFKDHLKTYKKRPIYWLFSSGKLKAFECLVYLHRYNEGTLSRMRMEYVTPLQSRMAARIDSLEDDTANASSSVARTKAQKEKDLMVKQLEELRAFDEELRHYADQRITLDLDDGVKVNYGKFGNLLAERKAITGEKD
ncbi:BREX-1 system adenine-specific DNA-methyltransferase PglX [Roseibium sp. LAB1]